jgi:hypothetical protein
MIVGYSEVQNRFLPYNINHADNQGLQVNHSSFGISRNLDAASDS